MSGPGSLMTSCAGLVSSQASLSTAAPTLPPVSLLAARAGSKGMGADLAAWYASYAPLMGQMALPFWSPLNIMSSPPLPTSLPSLRDSNSSADRERDHESLPRDQPAQEEQGEKDPSVRRKASASDSTKTKDVGGVSTEEKGGDAKSPSPHTSEGGGEGAIGYRGRRQSLKPEHYYYLLHPDTPYATLTQLFPGVSAQRYGRWRRKVRDSLFALNYECYPLAPPPPPPKKQQQHTTTTTKNNPPKTNFKKQINLKNKECTLRHHLSRWQLYSQDPAVNPTAVKTEWSLTVIRIFNIAQCMFPLFKKQTNDRVFVVLLMVENETNWVSTSGCSGDILLYWCDS